MATFVNDLRLTELATGEGSGTWGTTTNTNLELISEAFSFGTEAITTNADTHTTTLADGSTDPGRSMFLKYTGTLDSTCTITIGPNTVSKLWFIENATSGSQSIIIKQGSGATVTIANGQTKAIYSDGAGSGGAMVDALQDLSVPDLFIDDDLTFTSDSAVITFGADGDTTLTHTDGSGLTLNSTNKIMFNDASQFIQGSSATVLALGATDEIDLTATLIDINGNADVSGTVTATGTSVFASLDISGDIDVDGTTNLDVVDIDGAVDMASTLQVDGAITSSSGATITVADNSNNLSIVSTDADANIGPNIRFYRNSSSPADDDLVGGIVFDSRNDNSQDIQPVRIRVYTPDVSDGSEDSALDIATMTAGTLGNRFDILPTETVINNAGIDADFRVESNGNTHALFVDGGNDSLGIFNSVDTDMTRVALGLNGVAISGDTDGATIGSTGIAQLFNMNNFGTTNATIMLLAGGHGGSTTGQIASGFGFARHSASTWGTQIKMYVHPDDTADLDELHEAARVGPNEFVINETSNNYDFRVESNGNANMLFVDGGNNQVMVGIGTAPSSRSFYVESQTYPCQLRMGTSSVNYPVLQLRSGYVTGGQTGTQIDFRDGADNSVGSISSTVSGTAYNTSSDQRLKENIADANDAGELIDAIQVRQFDWKVDGLHQDYGMIAQELNTVAPEAVSGDADSDDMMGVDYSKLVPMLVKEIQSLRARVAQLESN